MFGGYTPNLHAANTVMRLFIIHKMSRLWAKSLAIRRSAQIGGIASIPLDGVDAPFSKLHINLSWEIAILLRLKFWFIQYLLLWLENISIL